MFKASTLKSNFDIFQDFTIHDVLCLPVFFSRSEGQD